MVKLDMLYGMESWPVKNAHVQCVDILGEIRLRTKISGARLVVGGGGGSEVEMIRAREKEVHRGTVKKCEKLVVVSIRRTRGRQ